MTGPGGWEVGKVSFQRRSGAAWSTDPLTLSATVEHEFRGSFTVANGSGPIPTGDIQVERHIDGSWVDWESYYGKSVEPGWRDGLDVFPPEWVTWPLFWTTYPVSMPTRLRLDWVDGSHWSKAIVVTVQGPVSGELGEFFEESDFGTIVLVGGIALRGIFQDPYREALGVEGRAPTLLVEEALVAHARHGDSVKVGSAEYTLRGRRPSAPGLAALRLEAV